MMRTRPVQNIINIIVLAIGIFMITMSSTIISHLNLQKENLYTSIETEWRQQAKRQLAGIQDKFMYDLNAGLVDPTNEYSLQQWAKINISGILNGGETGDVFMINLQDEKFIWDGSTDCAKPIFITNGRFMKDEADLHQDKEQAVYILDKMRLAKSTLDTNNNYWWNFDGSLEYLEWVVIPPGALGFDGETITTGGIKNQNYSKILIALGTQEDEVRHTFDKQVQIIDQNIYEIQAIVMIAIVICIFNMIVYVYSNKRVDIMKK